MSKTDLEPSTMPKVSPEDLPSPSIRDFENAIPYSKHDQRKALAFLATCREHLTPDDHSILRDLIPMEKPDTNLDIDLKQMMQEQMSCARALRNQYYNRDGSLRVTTDVKEAREALRSAQQIMDSILKKQGEIDMSSKLMIMEQSLTKVAQELPPEQQQKFYERTKRIMGENQ